MAGAYRIAPKLSNSLQSHMRRELETLANHSLSPNTGEVVNNTLKALNGKQ